MPLDDADKKFITEAIAASLKPLDDKFVSADATTKIVTQSIAKALGDLKIDEKIAAAVPKPPEPGATDDKTGKGKKGDVDPEVAKLHESVARLERENKEAAKARQEAEAAREESELLGALREQLNTAGVPADRQRGVVALLHAADKRVKRTPDGKPGMHFARKGYDEVVPLADAVKEWLAGDEGKAFLPPSGAQGTGQGAGTQVRHGTSAGAVKPSDLEISLG